MTHEVKQWWERVVQPPRPPRPWKDWVEPMVTQPSRPGPELGIKITPKEIAAPMEDQRKRIIEFFISRGLTLPQAAGVVGNLMQESGLNPSAVNKGENAQGIAQWRGDRLNALDQHGGGKRDLNTQLEFIMKELGTTEKRAGDKLRGAKDVQSATAAFMGYERPQGWTQNNPMAGNAWEDRLKYAQQALGQPSAQASRSLNVPRETNPPPAQNVAAPAVNAAQAAASPAASGENPMAAIADVLKSLGSPGQQSGQDDQTMQRLQAANDEAQRKRWAWAASNGWFS